MGTRIQMNYEPTVFKVSLEEQARMSSKCRNSGGVHSRGEGVYPVLCHEEFQAYQARMRRNNI